MPAHFLRQQGEKISSSWSHFSDAAQRIGVYTSMDYTNIMESLIQEWKIGDITGLNGAAEKGRDYLMGLPDRFRKCRTIRDQSPTGIPVQLDLLIKFLKPFLRMAFFILSKI